MLTGNPVMPLVTIAAVVIFVSSVFTYFGENSRGVEFFVESETEQAIIYVRARGNLSVDEKNLLVQQAENVVLGTEGVESVFAFAGAGGLNQNTGGASGPRDAIGQLQIEMTPWENRKNRPDLDGDVIMDDIRARLAQIPGIKTETLSLSRGPASGKPVHLRLKGDNWENLSPERRQLGKFAGLGRCGVAALCGHTRLDGCRRHPAPARHRLAD